MSRIGNLPIALPQGVDVKIDNNIVTVKGPKGELSQEVKGNLEVKVEDNSVVVSRGDEQKQTKSNHGLYRSLISNMVEGVSNGYKIDMELVGVGYRASSQGQQLELTLGYSHNIIMQLAPEVKVATTSERGQNPTISLESADKQLIGQVAAKIRSFRKPEPYKGKGIRFKGEHIRRKAGKAAGK